MRARMRRSQCEVAIAVVVLRLLAGYTNSSPSIVVCVCECGSSGSVQRLECRTRGDEDVCTQVDEEAAMVEDDATGEGLDDDDDGR